MKEGDSPCGLPVTTTDFHVYVRDKYFCIYVQGRKAGRRWSLWITYCCSVVHSVQLCVTPWTAACRPPCPSPSPGVCPSSCLLPSSRLMVWCPLLLLPSIFPSIRDFSSDFAVHFKWPKHWSFSISPSNEYTGLISFKMDWFDLLAHQRTLRSLLQHHSSKA